MSAATPVLDSAAGATAARDRVDLWVIALEPGEAGSVPSTLDAAERAFAARLRVGGGAWAAARAALRRVLAGYLGIAAAEVAFEVGPNAKPRLAAPAGQDLRFNLSHSGEVAIVAVRLGQEVGVDLEAVRPGVDGAAIVRETFPAGEREAAGDVSGAAFFRTWARREALAKATGHGILSPTDRAARERFSVLDVEGIHGHAAAVASEGTGWSVLRA